jgi:sulfur carrier protein
MTVRVTVNGEDRELGDEATVATVVELLSSVPEGRGIAVALDSIVVPRGEWATTELSDGATVEVVVAVQGG